MGPFQESVWLLLSAVYFIAIIPMTLNSHYSLASLIKHPERLNHMFWFVFSTFTNSFSVKSPLLSSGLGKNSASILIGGYSVKVVVAKLMDSFVYIPAFMSLNDQNDINDRKTLLSTIALTLI